MTDSPLYRDTFALCGVLLEELDHGRDYETLRRNLADGAMRILDDVVLALAGCEREISLRHADAGLRVLRSKLSLALELGVLERRIFLDFAAQADRIGRQIGGWLKKLS